MRTHMLTPVIYFAPLLTINQTNTFKEGFKDG
jgi:hypothetical protein